eukprot:364068-Chlamydomonas_euryale.AAC.1
MGTHRVRAYMRQEGMRKDRSGAAAVRQEQGGHVLHARPKPPPPHTHGTCVATNVCLGLPADRANSCPSDAGGRSCLGCSKWPSPTLFTLPTRSQHFPYIIITTSTSSSPPT